jgi:hypothetical protein
MTREISSLMAFAFAVAITAGLAFAVQLDTAPPWPVEKEYPDLGPIHNVTIIGDFAWQFDQSLNHPRFIHPRLTNSTRH